VPTQGGYEAAAIVVNGLQDLAALAHPHAVPVADVGGPDRALDGEQPWGELDHKPRLGRRVATGAQCAV
jgi:hypothetical protein